MKHPVRFALLALLVAVAACRTVHRLPPKAKPEVALPANFQPIVDEGYLASEVQDHLIHLTNRIGPRLTGSTRAAQAAEWTRARLESYGLRAYTEEWGTYAVGFDRGPWSARIVSPDPRPLVVGFNAWTPGTNGPVEGKVAKLPTSVADAEKLGESLRGAWVLSSPRTPLVDARTKINTALGKLGIAGFLRNAGGDLLVTSGEPTADFEKLPTRVSVMLRSDDYAAIEKSIDAGQEVRLEISMQNTFVKGPVSLRNVIADLPGTEKPDEYVIVGGHLDSWDGALGTVDNGTGVSTTLEAARLLTKTGARPRRTIRFMLWTGEEQGLLGSRAWIAKHDDVLKHISAVLVHDGGSNYVSGIAATPAMKPIFDSALGPLAKLDPAMPFEVRPVNGLPRGIGSDHDAFLTAGVPGFFWRQSGTLDYTHAHHTQYDTLDAANPEYQRHSSVVIACAALAIANLDTLVPREGLTAPAASRPGGGGRRMLGVQLGEDLTIAEVTPDLPAAKAGVKEGDVITKIGDEPVSDSTEMRNALRRAPMKTTITVQRAGKDLVLPLELPAPPASRPTSQPGQ